MSAAGEILAGESRRSPTFGGCDGGLLLPGITRYVPALGSIPSIDDTAKIFRTEMQTRGQRRKRRHFLADVFFSTYSTAGGTAPFALWSIDDSEHFREREEASLQQLLGRFAHSGRRRFARGQKCLRSHRNGPRELRGMEV